MEEQVREEIIEFAKAMERVMSKNDAVKGDSYKQMTHKQLQDLMIKEIEETQEENAKIKEWVDVALICMMIYYNTIHNKKKH